MYRGALKSVSGAKPLFRAARCGQLTQFQFLSELPLPFEQQPAFFSTFFSAFFSVAALPSQHGPFGQQAPSGQHDAFSVVQHACGGLQHGPSGQHDAFSAVQQACGGSQQAEPG